MESENKKIAESWGGTALPTRTKTIKVEVRTWDSLKSQKSENETFDDVIKKLLKERTVSVGEDNIKAIRYERKTAFFDTYSYRETIGFEFEYNDIKTNKSDFTFDLKIRKVFFKKRIMNPSEFFGVDNIHKHYSDFFLVVYFKAIALALKKEFRIEFKVPSDEEYENIARWRKLYYDYNLSNESFVQDIEGSLRLSEDEKPSEKWQVKIRGSVAQKIISEYDSIKIGSIKI